MPTGLGYLEFRAKVRNERAIELAFDGHRFYDIRRWMIAEEEGFMQGGMLGIKIYQIPESTEYRYEPYVFETRSFISHLGTKLKISQPCWQIRLT